MDFLARVRSEALKVWAGCDADVHKLPDDRSNGLWISSAVLCFRLKSRKARPGGILLRRVCTCVRKPVALCAVCFFQSFLQGKEAGCVLWSFTAEEALRTAKRFLALLGVERRESLGFKAWRADMASEMASNGDPLQKILDWCDWRLRSVFELH